MTHGKSIGWPLVMAGLVALFSGMTSAAETATATISATPSGSKFLYDIALTNTSSDGSNIGTFWFSWTLTPDKDYMEAKPTNITDPTGWVGPVNGTNNAADGNSIENFDIGGPADLLTPGHTFHFGFISSEPLSQLLGLSSFAPNPPETTSFVYAGSPVSDAGFQLVVTAVPEPVSASMLALFGGGLLMRRRRA